MEPLSAKRQRQLTNALAASCPSRPAGGEGRRSSRRKRPRRQAKLEHTAASGGDGACCYEEGPLETATVGSEGGVCEYEMCLYVRWHSQEGGTRVNRLPLDAIASVGDLRGLFRRLIHGAFSGCQLPDYLTSPDFYKFSPAEDFITLPGDISRTQFRLVVTLGGWEYGVVDRELGVAPDPARTLLVTAAEFESDVFELDGQECVMNLISYPTICVRRDFLDAAVRDLLRGLAESASGGSCRGAICNGLALGAPRSGGSSGGDGAADEQEEGEDVAAGPPAALCVAPRPASSST